MMITIENLPIQGFDLNLPVIHTESSEYYPISALSAMLGYASPQSLIKAIPEEYKTSVKELYAISTLEFDFPPTLQQFKKGLDRYKPLWFTDINGIEFALARNTFTIPRLKEAIANTLGIKITHKPRNESVFFDLLNGLLEGYPIQLNRHAYIGGYFADIEINEPKIIIEFDENKHLYYSKENEINRENSLKSLGYSILRVSDSTPITASAARIFKEILKMSGYNSL